MSTEVLYVRAPTAMETVLGPRLFVPKTGQDPFTVKIFIQPQECTITCKITKELKVRDNYKRAVYEGICGGIPVVIKWWSYRYEQAAESYNAELLAYHFLEGEPFIPHKYCQGRITHGMDPGFVIITEKRPGETLNSDVWKFLPSMERHTARVEIEESLEKMRELGIFHKGILGANVMWDVDTKMLTIVGWRHARLATEDDPSVYLFEIPRLVGMLNQHLYRLPPPPKEENISPRRRFGSLGQSQVLTRDHRSTAVLGELSIINRG